MQNKCPCYKDGLDCEIRAIGCHATCAEYKTWKAKLATENERKRKEKEKTQTMSESAKRKIWKKQRYRNQLKPFRKDMER